MVVVPLDTGLGEGGTLEGASLLGGGLPKCLMEDRFTLQDSICGSYAPLEVSVPTSSPDGSGGAALFRGQGNAFLLG